MRHETIEYLRSRAALRRQSGGRGGRGYLAPSFGPDELDIEVYEESVPLDALHRASFSLADMVDDGQPIPREYADAEPLPGLMGHDWQGRAGPRKQPGALRCRRCAITWHEHRAYPVECCRRN